MAEPLSEIIRSAGALPSLPSVAVEMLRLVQEADVTAERIADTVSRDAALTGRVLKTVNSSFYGRAHSVSTLKHAIVILGLETTKTLVLGFSLTGSLKGEKVGGFDAATYWRRSLYGALAARLLAERAGCGTLREEAFLVALLADVGMLVLDRALGESYGKVLATAGPLGHAGLADAERAAFGFDHAEAGGLLAAQWQLPPVLAVPIANHHSPERAEESLRPLANVVAAASLCADVWIDADASFAANAARIDLQKRFNINGDEADAILAEVARATKEAASLFEIKVDPQIDLDATLKQANQTLVDFTLASQQRAQKLTQENQTLRVAATTDRLTGLSNRAAFDAAMQAAFDAHAKIGRPVSLVMIDVDKFKSVNDRFGHAAGDAVLQSLGQALRGIARQRPETLPARYGGEELALVLPGVDGGLATAVAETTRKLIERLPIISGGTKIAVTASLGVATLDADSRFATPAELIRAADSALYKAKHSGRNNVQRHDPATAQVA